MPDISMNNMFSTTQSETLEGGDLQSKALNDMYFNTRIQRIFGLPFAYNENSDPGFSSFDASILADLPIVHLTPGYLKYKSKIGNAVASLFNLVATDITPTSVDERKVRFNSAWQEYLKYLNVLATPLFNDMVLNVDLGEGAIYSSTTIEDMLAAYTMGFNSPVKSDVTAGFKEMDDDKKGYDALKPVDEFNKKKLEEKYKESITFTPEQTAQQRDEAMKAEAQHLAGVAEKATAGYEGDPSYNSENAQRLFTRGMSFFMDASSAVSEDFSNSYGESKVAQEQTAKAQEMRDLYNEKDVKGVGMAAGSRITNVMEKIKSVGVSGLVTDTLGGLKNLGSVSLKGMYHGAIAQLPEVWNSSDFNRNYRVSMKFNSPYGDPMSVFLNVYLPMLSLMAMIMPRYINAQEYIAPFIVKADAPGAFVCDLGIITEMSIQRGGDASAWTINGLPTSVEISLSIKDLMPSLVMAKSIVELNANKSTALFLRNLAGASIDPLGMMKTSLQRRVMTASSQAGFKYDPLNISKSVLSKGKEHVTSVMQNWM